MSTETVNLADATPRVWNHSRKGRIAGHVVRQDDEWTTIICTEPNRAANVGDELEFRNTLATEVTP